MHILKKSTLVIKPQKFIDGKEWRLNKYCIVTKYKNFYAIFNPICAGLILITDEEFNDILKPTNNSYIVKNYYIVPKGTHVYKLAKQIRDIFTLKQPNTYNTINTYTILPTSKCNARCLYCFENGQQRKNMSQQTAEGVVKFICKKSDKNNKIDISWFGGEPLVKEEIIDFICTNVKNNGYEIESNMISNGYLFNNEKIEKYKNIWNLKRVQITLDGVEEDYNKIKNYKRSIKNPFNTVIQNIEYLALNDIKVSIRINYSYKNIKVAENTLLYCKERFSNFKNIHMYFAPLHEEVSIPEMTKNTLKGLKYLFNNYPNNISLSCNNTRNLQLPEYICMADSGHSVVINPDGYLGVCEHYIDSNFFGSIYDETYDFNMRMKYVERIEELPICKHCNLFPICKQLKICSGSYCDKYIREANLLAVCSNIYLYMRNYIK